jgi:hypothetical protein
MNEVNKMTIHKFINDWVWEKIKVESACRENVATMRLEVENEQKATKDLKALIGNEMRRLLPNKKNKSFKNDCYCKSCRLSEEFCQCDGYNNCLKRIKQRINDYMEVSK